MNRPCNIDSNRERPITRRVALKSALVAGGVWLADCGRLSAGDAIRNTQPSPHRYKIGVCDWMMLKRQKLGAFPLAKDVGADGVEVDMGSLGQRETFQNALADA